MSAREFDTNREKDVLYFFLAITSTPKNCLLTHYQFLALICVETALLVACLIVGNSSKCSSVTTTPSPVFATPSWEYPREGDRHCSHRPLLVGLDGTRLLSIEVCATTFLAQMAVVWFSFALEPLCTTNIFHVSFRFRVPSFLMCVSEISRLNLHLEQIILVSDKTSKGEKVVRLFSQCRCTFSCCLT